MLDEGYRLLVSCATPCTFWANVLSASTEHYSSLKMKYVPMKCH